MPIFQRRRYMRKEPGAVERVIGPALLGMLALTVAAFLATTGALGSGVKQSGVVQTLQRAIGLSDAPLFHIDPADLEETAPPFDRHFALSMLPENLGNYRRAQFETVALDAPPDSHAARSALPADARGYGAYVLINARYIRQDPDEDETDGPRDTDLEDSGGMSVWVVDMREPANAFGLSGVRRSASAGSARLGSGGWVDDHAGCAGFWTGPYYFELCGLDDEAIGSLNETAVELAAGRLNYGRPFWSERVLALNTLRPDSFRYVRGAPLGLEPLAEAWLADSEEGVTLGVRRIDGPARDASLNRLRELYASDDASAPEGYGAEAPAGYGVEAAPAGYGDAVAAYGAASSDDVAAGPWEAMDQELSPQAVAGAVDGRAFVAWPQDPHLFVTAGPDPATVRMSAVALAERWRVDTRRTVGDPGDLDAETAPARGARFADLGDPDILAPTRIEHYAEDVYAKINGREPHFRAYDFIDLRVGMYVHTVRRENYEVFLFDMAEPENALGIYQTERTGDVELVDVGRGGYLSGASLFFWKGPYYVYILGPAEGDAESAATARRIAEVVADTIDDDGEPFWAEDLLPLDDKVPGSKRYQARSALGFDFLNRVFSAAYEDDGTSYQLYLLRADSAEDARSLFELYAEEIGMFEDSVLAREETPDGQVIVSEFFGMYDVAFHKGVYYGGVTECDDREVAERAAAFFRDTLPLD